MPSWLPPFGWLFLNPDACAGAGRSRDPQVPPDLDGPLAHADQTDPPAVPGLPQIKALPLVLNLDPDGFRQVQPDARLRRSGVLDDVVQRLLGNAKEALLLGGPQARQRIAFNFERDHKVLWQRAVRKMP